MNELIVKDSLIISIWRIFPLLIVFGGLSLIFLLSNNLLFSTLSLFTFIAVFWYFLSRSRSTILSDDGISLERNKKKTFIKWSEIQAMAYSSGRSTLNGYQIRTTKGTFNVPFMPEYKKFEEIIVRNGKMDLVKKGIGSETLGTVAKRWARDGEKPIIVDQFEGVDLYSAQTRDFFQPKFLLSVSFLRSLIPVIVVILGWVLLVSVFNLFR